MRSFKFVKKQIFDDNDEEIMLIICVPISECNTFLFREVKPVGGGVAESRQGD